MPRPKKPLEPITDYEAAIWEVWDRLQKAVLVDQALWTKRAKEAFLELLQLDRRAYAKSPAAYHVAHSYWLTARGHDAEVRAAELAWIEMRQADQNRVKTALRQQQKDLLKARKAEWRAEEKAQKAREKAMRETK